LAECAALFRPTVGGESVTVNRSALRDDDVAGDYAAR
jgi:hypothetical protein